MGLGGRSSLGGGIGILRDDAGDDRYEAEMFAQGAAYFFGAGLLWDRGGEDRYSAIRYAQGCGVHQAAGILRDEAGNDRYALAVGVGQGMGLDQSVGLFARGAILVFDYGFPRREYYHPQRAMGTLMCHYRHRAHGDPFWLPGAQDITAHVDFSALADAAREAGLEVLGYTSQSNFLVNCGITDLLGREDPEDFARYAPVAAAANTLLSPAEMGELFKVLCVGKGVGVDLAGFSQGDRSRSL